MSDPPAHRGRRKEELAAGQETSEGAEEEEATGSQDQARRGALTDVERTYGAASDDRGPGGASRSQGDDLEQQFLHGLRVGDGDEAGPPAPASPGKAKVLQTGGRTIEKRTATALNEALGESLPPREWGRRLESLKRDLDLRNDHHGKILSNGDYTDRDGNVLGNLLEY